MASLGAPSLLRSLRATPRLLAAASRQPAHSLHTLRAPSCSLGTPRHCHRTPAPGPLSLAFSRGPEPGSLFDVRARSFQVSGPGAVDSPLMSSMKQKISDALSTEDVVVQDMQGDGRHVSIRVVAEVFEGKRSVERQRMVYKAIWEELQGAVHAVDQLVTLSPSESK